MRISDWSSDVCSSDLQLGSSRFPCSLSLVERQVRFHCPGAAIVGDEPVDGCLHSGDHSDLAEAPAQVPAQQFEPVEVRLLSIWRPSEVSKCAMRGRLSCAEQELLVGEELTDTERQRIEHGVPGAVLQVGEVTLHVESGRAGEH